MGKKSTLKKIRKIAEQLPTVQANVKHSTRVMGSEMIAEGNDKVDGQRVKENHRYKKTATVVKDINHNRRMKQMYYRHGKAGITAYINTVNTFVSEEKLRQASKFKTEEQDGTGKNNL